APASGPYADLPGWPVSILGGSSPPTAAGVDPSYPGLEVAVGTPSSAGHLYFFHSHGTPVAGRPACIRIFFSPPPAIADPDGVGALDISAGDFAGNRVWAVRADGTPMPGWPISVGGNVRSTASVADLDPSYPGLEVVIGVQDGTVQAWHADGTNV